MGRIIRAHQQAQEGEASSQARRLYWASQLYEGNPLNMPPPVFRIRIHFLRIRIRIQWIRMEANTNPDTDPDPDPDPIRIQGFNDQKLKEKNSWKKN